MTYYQKTCEDCGAIFSARSPQLATIKWAEHYKTCPGRDYGDSNETLDG